MDVEPIARRLAAYIGGVRGTVEKEAVVGEQEGFMETQLPQLVQRGTHLLEGAADQGRGSFGVSLKVVIHLVAAQHQQLHNFVQFTFRFDELAQGHLMEPLAILFAQDIHALVDVA